MSMTDKLLGRKPEPTIDALDALGILRRVQLRETYTVAFPEAFVVDTEGQRVLPVHDGRISLAALQQCTAQPFRVRLRYQPATWRSAWQDPVILQHVKLLGRAPGAVDLQLVALLVDLLQTEVSEHTVQHLGQAQSLLASYLEAGDAFVAEDSLGSLAAGLIWRGEDWYLLYYRERLQVFVLFDFRGVQFPSGLYQGQTWSL